MTNSGDNTYSFGQAFKKFLKDQHLDEKYSEKQLISMWGEIMGKPIANRTTKVFIANKVMYVKLNSAPLKQELLLAKDKVLDLLGKHVDLSIIEDIRFI